MASPGGPQLILDSTASPSLAEYYLNHPNGRIVSAFFLGCVFMNALQYMTSSLFFRGMLARIRRFIQVLRRKMPSRNVDLELPTARDEKVRIEDVEETESLRQYNDHTALIFTLNLCFMLAGLAQFISLLTFRNQTSWGTGCAFVVAWGGMASQLGRLLGVMILTVELSRIGVKRWELVFVCGAAFVGLVFVFATNATNNGTTSLAQSAGEAFCYRDRFLATTLTSSIIRLILELFVVVRLVMLSSNRRRWLSDRSVKAVTIVRACSLLILDLMTVVPDSIPTNIVADFLPFCIGTVIVLAAFNWKWTTLLPSGQSHVQSLVFVSKNTSDPLLMPTPFTLHFPRSHRGSTHSWCSHSQHAPPSSARTPVSAQGERAEAESEYHGSTHSAEHAVLETATTAWRRSVRQISLASELGPLEHPHSAPAQLNGFPNVQRFPRRILSSQLKLAAQLEAESLHLSQAESTGPIVPHLGSRPAGVFIIEDDSEGSHDSATSPTSAVFGSDIVQFGPGKRREDNGKQVSPAPTQTSFLPSPYESRRSTYRFSYDSSISRTSSSSDRDDISRTTQTPRSSHSRTFLSPLEAQSRSPWRNTSRSFTSIRHKSREEMPTVREASPAPGAVWINRLPTNKRSTFGQSLRRSKRASTFSSLKPQEPVPPMPAVLPTAPPTHRFPPLTIQPTLPLQFQLSPATPGPPPAISSPGRPRQGSFDRPGAGVLGPRPLPSALLVSSGSGWPVKADSETLSQLSAHRHAASSPSAYSQESVDPPRRPSI